MWSGRSGAALDEVGAAYLEHPGLTRRELEVTALVCRGLTNREIAERLSLSVRTVEGYVLRACDKAGVCSRRELAEIDLRADLPVSPRS